MREALKVFKTLAESGEFDEAKLQQVKNEATQITIKPNDAGKLTKWLNKQ
jgi:type II secretory pathway component PulM